MRYGTPSYTVVGYTVDGMILCPNCIDTEHAWIDHPEPVFLDDVDDDNVCEECGQELGI